MERLKGEESKSVKRMHDFETAAGAQMHGAEGCAFMIPH